MYTEIPRATVKDIRSVAKKIAHELKLNFKNI